MRHVLFVDTKIPTADLEFWMDADTYFFETHAQITPTYYPIRYDFSDYPVEPDSDGDMRPTRKFLTELTDDVYDKYNEWGTDFVMLLVHEDNWKSDPPGPNNGIWGVNMSLVYHSYHVQYCRWDKDNKANTFGTLWHERHHAFDALIKQETGVDIRPIVGVNNFDSGCTHGREDPWEYIRYKENARSLRLIAPHLRRAIGVREQRHEDYMTKQKTVISLLEQMVYLYKKLINRKNGIKL